MILALWEDSTEGGMIAQLVGYEQGKALVRYLIRSRETVLKALISARGEDVVRVQGQIQMLDELIDRLEGAGSTARKVEQREKAKRG